MIEEKYINYGECQVCHKKRGRLPGTELCNDCLDEYLDKLQEDAE